MKFIVLAASALTHVISYDTNLSLRTVLLFVTAKLATAITGVTPLVHPGAVLAQHWHHNLYSKNYLREDTAARLLSLLGRRG